MDPSNMVPVQSSNIVAIGYDGEPRELRVEFKGNRTYVYSGVSPEEFDAFLKADSKGKHLNENIKPKHAFVRVA